MFTIVTKNNNFTKQKNHNLSSLLRLTQNDHYNNEKEKNKVKASEYHRVPESFLMSCRIMRDTGRKIFTYFKLRYVF